MPTPEEIEAFKTTQRPILIFAGLMVLALFSTGLPLPWGVAGLVFVAAALAAGIRAFIVVMRSRRGGIMLPVIGLLVVFTLALGAQTGLQIVLWQPTMDHQECVANAITVEAADACAAEYKKASNDYLEQHFPGLVPSQDPTP